jgi:uncharacterized protein YggU (UPF0235/DUF167 family)
MKVQVTAPPVEGEANHALERLLARLTDLPRSAVRVVGGAKSRDKVVQLTALDPTAVAARLAGLVDKMEGGD